MGFSYLNVFNSLFFDIESHKDIKRTLEQASDVLDSLITKFGEIQNELTLGISGNDDFVDCFDQIFRHVSVVRQQLLGVFRQAVSTARCQVLDNIFHKFLF